MRVLAYGETSQTFQTEVVHAEPDDPNRLDCSSLPGVALDVHASVATFSPVGTGIVRTRPCFPTRSTMHHRPSRCWMWPTVSAATSDLRSPQPRRTARVA